MRQLKNTTQFRITSTNEKNQTTFDRSLLWFHPSRRFDEEVSLTRSIICFLLLITLIGSGMLYFNHQINTSSTTTPIQTQYSLITLTTDTYVYPSAEQARLQFATNIIYPAGEYLIDQVDGNCIHIINNQVGGAWIIKP